MVLVVDYKMGNLGSIRNMLKKLGADVEIASDPARLGAAQRIILPGVGRFDRAMENLDRMGWRRPLDEAVHEKKIPTLGVCLGMQLMTSRSEEGHVEGLGWIEGECRRFEAALGLPVPHMGWNDLQPKRDFALIRQLGDEPRFYFAHSYYVELANPEDVVARTEYGRSVVSVFNKGHISGVQFHPEKSHRYGMQLLRNFVAEPASDVLAERAP